MQDVKSKIEQIKAKLDRENQFHNQLMRDRAVYGSTMAEWALEKLESAIAKSSRKIVELSIELDEAEEVERRVNESSRIVSPGEWC